LPDSTFFWWYPKKAPWLNVFPHLRVLSNGADVTRKGVLLAILIALILNLILFLLWRKIKTQRIQVY